MNVSNPPRADITEAALLIRINSLYSGDSMPTEALYDATRSCWKIGERRDGVEYAFAVYKGIIREVYTIEKWVPAGQSPCKSLVHRERDIKGFRDRWEFIGGLAEASIRAKYIGRSVAHEFQQGASNPIKYLNVPG